MHTRRSPRNQDRLFRALFLPPAATATPVPPSHCWDCNNYPPAGRSRGHCTLSGMMVQGVGVRPCFKARLARG